MKVPAVWLISWFPAALALLASGVVKYSEVATLIPLWNAVPAFAQLQQNPAAWRQAVLVA